MALLLGGKEVCAVCYRDIASGEACIPTIVKCRTRGFNPRIEAPAQTVYLCQCCAILKAYGAPPEGAFNLAVYIELRDIFKADPSVAMTAVDEMGRQWTPEARAQILQRMTSPHLILTEGEILPPAKTLKAAG